jgi:EAL domain-containing protein (putative c-di-GMP-specific phosphodiesterase class I)
MKTIKSYPVRPENLLLTFTEQGLLDHIAMAKPVVAGLRKMRIRVAVSHFGVTPQALQLITQVPVDFLRLDEAVIKALTNPRSSDKITEVLREARTKGARIVAKQVTDAQTMALLWTLGVHFIEGDYIPDIGQAVHAA